SPDTGHDHQSAARTLPELHHTLATTLHTIEALLTLADRQPQPAPDSRTPTLPELRELLELRTLISQKDLRAGRLLEKLLPGLRSASLPESEALESLMGRLRYDEALPVIDRMMTRFPPVDADEERDAPAS
ncbi:MAG: hypothetical protein HQM02_11645, partial [Magnetococcales bacterium]|nr:hypothetical protein [Magnetococcales bacterium]